jgi:iron complex outermembrane receptor protein
MKFILSVIFIILPFMVFAQQNTYTGTIVDENGKALQGATVAVKNTTTKVLSTINGTFSINAEKGGYLEINFSGYKSMSILLGNDTSISVQMKVNTSDIEEVVVIGSRRLPRSKIESTVPVDVIDIKTIIAEVPQTNITDLLNTVAPSFNSTTQTVSDGTDHIDPATVRGLGPDQTLVMVNGKRRYTSALVNVNGTMGRGSVGTDLNAISIAGIERIEVLRDGAAAQYGSDAIAGVLNVQLNRTVNKGRAIISYGSNATTYQTFTHANSGNFPQGIDPVYINNNIVDGQKLNT